FNYLFCYHNSCFICAQNREGNNGSIAIIPWPHYDLCYLLLFHFLCHGSIVSFHSFLAFHMNDVTTSSFVSLPGFFSTLYLPPDATNNPYGHAAYMPALQCQASLL